jgi:hypothetical protein
VADRLFEGEKAGLHVIESIVGPWVFRSTQRHRAWTRDFRTALRCRPDFLEPFFGARPGTGRRALRPWCRLDFLAPDFEDSGPISPLMRLLPWNDFGKPFPNVPRSPTRVDLTMARIWVTK